MRMKFLTLFAALLMLGACETSSDEQAATDSGGSATSSSSSDDAVSSTTIPGPTPGSQEDLTVNVGDRVFYGKYAGTEVTVAGEDYKILEVKDVLAKIEQ